MKRLRLSVLLAGLCPALSSAGTLNGTWTGFFDGAGPEKSLGQMIQQAPLAPASGKAGKTWDAAGFAQGVQQALDQYARLPDAAQQQAIDEALTFLEGTESGVSLCYSLATKCTSLSLAKMNVEIRVKTDLAVGAAGQPPQPVYAIGNKKLVILTPAMFTGKSTAACDLAAAIAHQLSHAQDVVMTASNLEKIAMVTEEKAFLAELMVYTQLYNQDRRQIEDPLMTFMLGFWHYKEHGGPLPKDFDYKGKSYSAAGFIKTYLEPARSGKEGVINLTRTFFYPKLSSPSSLTPVEIELEKAVEKRLGLLADEYSLWREANGLNEDSYYNPAANIQPPVTPPVIPPVTLPVTPPVTPPAAPREWIAINGGKFMMGTNELIDGFEGPKPVREVSIKTFEMSRTAVTVAQYAECVTKGKCTLPGAGGNCNWGVPGRQSHPINCVIWDQADQFAKFKGARLPSESEWEYAARSGGQSRKYPWGGAAPAESLLVMNTETTMPVCSKPAGNTNQGLCDMAGNVRQWVQDKYQNSYNGAPSDGSAFNGVSGYWVMRGSCFNSAGYAQDDNYSRGPGFNSICVGFRLAR